MAGMRHNRIMKIRALTLLALLCILPIFAKAAPTATISGTPASGVPPYQATLTWSSTGTTACTAADGWSGSKATSGTQTITVTAATKVSLKCTAATGWTDVVWAAVTVNTDGTPLTNLAGYYVYRGTSASNLTKIQSVGPGATTYRDANLAPRHVRLRRERREQCNARCICTAGGES